ncbi:hypothetical protein JCM3766R1_006062 [Sporobolomyces carnicolor]
MEHPSLRQRHQAEGQPTLSSNSNESTPTAPPRELLSSLEDTYPPFIAPDVTIKELLSVIPRECFERSVVRSSLYVLQDVVLMLSLAYLATYIDPSFGQDGAVVDGRAGIACKWAAWVAYWTFQGWVMTGLWVLGHECGHQAFSTSKTINNAVGLVIHSFLLVPYHSWRISHARHHAATGHMDRDQVFVPRTLDERSRNWVENPRSKGKNAVGDKGRSIELDELLEDAPLYRLVTLIGQQFFGWPLYLIMNASGQTSYPAWTNHFSPNSIIFDARHRYAIVLSDLALLVTVVAFYLVSHRFDPEEGRASFIKFYFVPYLVVNNFLVAITFLQHTDSRLAHYRGDAWTFARGALSTIDREFIWSSFVGKRLLHGICETHVAHHDFLDRKARERQEQEQEDGVQVVEYYVSTNENFVKSLWKSYQECRFVDREGDIVMYKDAKGRQRRRVVQDGRKPELAATRDYSGIEGI